MTDTFILFIIAVFTAGFIVGGVVGYLFAISTEGMQDARENKLED